MENKLKVFSNSNFGEVRTKLSETNEPLFCLTDVCQALDLRQGDVRQRLADGVVSTQPIVYGVGGQFTRVSTNYLQLKTIYKQRKNHKLKEDWGAICTMIEELPYKELITK